MRRAAALRGRDIQFRGMHSSRTSITAAGVNHSRTLTRATMTHGAVSWRPLLLSLLTLSNLANLVSDVSFRTIYISRDIHIA